MAETEPNRDIALDIIEEPAPAKTTMGSDDAPYGRKPDGTPYQRRHGPRGPRSGNGRSTARTTRGSLRTQIGGMLQLVNMPVQILSAKNALDSIEIDALAKALDEECQRNARFRKYMEQMLAVQGGTSLVLVVAAIAGRRIVRNGIVDVPDQIGGKDGADALLGGIIAMTTGNPLQPNLMQMNQQQEAAA